MPWEFTEHQAQSWRLRSDIIHEQHAKGRMDGEQTTTCNHGNSILAAEAARPRGDDDVVADADAAINAAHGGLGVASN